MIKYVGSAKRKMALIVDFKYSEIVFISYIHSICNLNFQIA